MAVTGRGRWLGNHVWEVEALFHCVAQNFLVEFLLLRLEVTIQIDALFNHPHVWAYVGVECLDEMSHIISTIPTLDLFEKAQVGNYDGWCSTHARRTVDKDVKTLVVDQVIQMLGGVKQI